MQSANGIVLDRKTKEPVKAVALGKYDHEDPGNPYSRRTYTDDSGRFYYHSISGGLFRCPGLHLYFSKKGYKPVDTEWDCNSENDTVWMEKLQTSYSYPRWFEKAFQQQKLDSRFGFLDHLKPQFLEADFNGDGAKDIAVLIKNKTTGDTGIIIIHSRSNEYFIFGAGTPFGDDSSWVNHSWIDQWHVYSEKTADVPEFDKTSGDILGTHKIDIPHPGILIENVDMGAGGIIYWNGKKYSWVHQGE